MKPSDFASMMEAGVETAPPPVRTPTKPTITPERKSPKPWLPKKQPGVSPGPKACVTTTDDEPKMESFKHWDAVRLMESK